MQTVQRLRDAGLRVMVLSGDNVAAARALAGRAGIAAADVTAGVGPAGKVEFVERLRRSGAVRAGPEATPVSELTPFRHVTSGDSHRLCDPLECA